MISAEVLVAKQKKCLEINFEHQDMNCNGINGDEMKDRTNVISGRQKIQIPI